MIEFCGALIGMEILNLGFWKPQSYKNSSFTLLQIRGPDWTKASYISAVATGIGESQYYSINATLRQWVRMPLYAISGEA